MVPHVLGVGYAYNEYEVTAGRWKEFEIEFDYAEENRAAKEKVEKKRAEKKAEQERIEKRRVEKAEAKDKTDEFTISAVGTDVRSITAKLTEGLSSGGVSGTVGFDVKA